MSLFVLAVLFFPVVALYALAELASWPGDK